VQRARSPSPGGGGSARGARRGGVSASALVHQSRGFRLARAIKRRVDHVQNAVRILNDVVVPKSQDAIALAFEPARPHIVASGIFCFAVLRAIEFDDEPSGHAGEIGDVVSNRHLAAEMPAVQLECPEQAPEFAFSVGRVVAKTASGLAAEVADGSLRWHRRESPHPAAHFVHVDPPPPGEGDQSSWHRRCNKTTPPLRHRSQATPRRRPSPARARAGCSSAAP